MSYYNDRQILTILRYLLTKKSEDSILRY